MNKFLPLLFLAGFIFLPQVAYAGLSEGCFPAVQCNAGDDYFGGSSCAAGAPTCCQSHIETLTGASNSCESENGAPAPGKSWAFSCDAGCYQKSNGGGSVNPCPGGIMVNGHCLIKLSLLDDDVPVTGTEGYKIWDGADLTQVVHLDTAGCANSEVPVADAASPTGWSCGTSGVWSLNGADAYYNTGNVGINTTTPAYDLDVSGDINGTQLCIAGSCISSWAFSTPWTVSGANVYRTSGSVGIGTSSPSAMLDVALNSGGGLEVGASAHATGDVSVAFGSSTASGSYSFAEGVSSTASGAYSVAMGYAADASASSATAIGGNASATANEALALGNFAQAQLAYSTAIGRSTTANGNTSTAIGSWATTNAQYSTAVGYGVEATGTESTAMGVYTFARPYRAFVVGSYNAYDPLDHASGWYLDEPLFVIGNGQAPTSRSNAVTVLKNGNFGIGTDDPVSLLDVDGTIRAGYDTDTPSYLGHAELGYCNPYTGDYACFKHLDSADYALLQSGLGTTYLNAAPGRSVYFRIGNATEMTLTSAGNFGLGTTSPSAKLDVEGAATIGSSANAASGLYAVAVGGGSDASGSSSFAAGNATASDQYAMALGDRVTASGSRSVAMGYFSMASGDYSTATGSGNNSIGNYSFTTGSSNTATGPWSVAMNRGNSVPGTYATALGYSNIAQSYASTVVGRYNLISGSASSWVNTDPLFVIGNGSGNSSRSNAFSVRKDGHTVINGKVSIGGDSTSYDLVVIGTAAKTGGGSWSVFSDARLKDVHGSYEKGLNEILQLNPVEFNYKTDNPVQLDSDHTYVGLIAQEVELVFPEAVTESTDGYLDFNMHSVSVAMINAIKELKAENDALKAVVCELKPEAELCN